MQLEYFIIGGCTIQILYSRIMPRAVLALNIADVRKPALLLALFQIQKKSRLNELKNVLSYNASLYSRTMPRVVLAFWRR